MITISYCICALFLSHVFAAPASSISGVSSMSSTGTYTSSAVSPIETVPFASDDPNPILWLPEDNNTVHQPIRGSLGATILGPTNNPIVDENADLVAPPTTDVGTVDNAKWPFSLSQNQLWTGGWARQQNLGVMPIAKEMAGVNMRLKPGAIRELHWHTAAEWAYVLKGSTQITAVNQNGQNYIATVNAGDLWYFPPGIPHSLQGTSDDPQGTEFLLVFDTGNFNEDSTFLLTDWMSQVPKEVLANNFQVDQSAFNDIPGSQLYIFPSNPPPDNQQNPVSPQGTVPEPFSFELSKFNATQFSGGTAKIVDSTIFNASKTIAVAEVTVEPGAIRELHWHPTQDEWTYYLEGEARVTLFASGRNSRTFDYQPGDIGYVPAAYGHYVQNVGNTTLKFLEIFKTDKFADLSLSQWLALIPPDLVKAHLQVSDDTIMHFNKTKPVVVGPVGPSS
ncbi:oxalate decarboxylase [Crucibulum laeve]|uniref:Oxalate decarboxylase n=1 Tax=Crucibulum laeve TaxID=68775 RepID=A0A5C3MM31_9AGAR|nr:oxalate decarboxylase [Crucibulum laeve]